ncbi:multidrug transporter (plasmid) [Fulvitalea axinellae]|uniref:Multidrug transporter n=1 Tax=Fulvitalea axinellae TaxID=1182444 RepID=A0AAU9CK30_9BACT|nr:multidrug transporter [Fulvitalea axinellae]
MTRNRIIYYWALALVLPLTLQSCLVRRKYSEPKLSVDTEALYRTDVVTESSDKSIGEMPWEEFFSDEILRKHIRTGLENNYDVRIALQNIVAADAYRKQGKAGYLPTASLAGRASWQNPSDNTAFGGGDFNMDQFDVTGSFSWEADIWGKITSQNKAFRASYLQTLAAKQAVVTRMISDISSSYFDLLALDRQLDVTERTIVNRQRSLNVIRALKDAGQDNLTEVAVKQAEAQLYDAQQIKADLQGRIRLTENALSVLLGRTPGPVERGVMGPEMFASEAETLSPGVPLALLSNRPDLRAAEQGFVNAFEMTNVAKADLYPALSLSADVGLMGNEISKVFRGDAFYYNLFANLTQPIFNGRKLKTQLEVAKTKEEQALLSFEQAILNASREVNDALVNYKTSAERKISVGKSFEAYSQATRQSEALLASGMVNYLEVLRAQQNELATELSLVDLQNGQNKALLNLYVSLGGGGIE